VVIPDAQTCEQLDAGQKRAYRDAGISAMQSTPLISRSGTLVGMISTHWRHSYHPTDSELENFDILARQAADALERTQAERAIRQNEAWLAAQKESLQAALNGEPLEQSLGALVRGAIERLGPGTRAAFYRASPEGTTLHHIVGMSPEYADVVDGFKVSLESFSCGRAAQSRQPMLTSDVNEDPAWHSWRHVAEKFAFRGCWSFPLHTPKGELLGTFALYFREPRRATQGDIVFASAIADTAAIIISRHNEATVRQQALENLARAKEEAEAANMAKDNFLASLSHELRTPLTPVLATLSSWEARRSFPKELSEDLAMVRRNVDLEARLIDDLLDLTRIAKGKITLNPEVLNVQKALDAVIAMYLSDIRGKRIRLTVRPLPGDCFARCDPGRLQQAFWNVLKNAVKFTPEGGKIDIAALNDGQGRVRVVITDTGIGISKPMLTRLFQPFEQETAGHYGGLGLGLAITKRLLEAQHGTIEARSEGSGKGSSFTITLPCEDPPLVSSSGHAERREFERLSSDGSYRVLLIEDHPDTARVLGRLLGGNGHTVTTVHSIAEALTVLRHQDFDILVSDIGLPDGTGIELIEAVRGELQKQTPAIALTGFGMEEDVRRTLQAGFTEHLTKPVNLARLEQTIQRTCKK
jgi:signal transduction histidine kinase